MDHGVESFTGMETFPAQIKKKSCWPLISFSKLDIFLSSYLIFDINNTIYIITDLLFMDMDLMK